MKYKCLILDHDDTVVDSTASIHYPAFLEALKIMCPSKTLTLEDYFRDNFHPGFIEMCKQRFGMTDADLEIEVEIWKDYVSNHVAKAYPGMKEIIERFRKEGGKICVVSHSYDFNIRRDYEANDLPMPDMIFGWECPPEQRKPYTYALEQIEKKYDIRPQEMVMVDDLKPGYDMARSYGVPFVGAGWSNDIEEIRSFMEKNSDYYFTKVSELEAFLFA
ncbi:MAG: HAD family phosphatase [Lachnospiraceae bacterium]|nr:HAD family phosphatase [Lachnospiraceae bacterium]MBQ6993726.1 HAD family phosphatase [Lachnospiraceae bacterium]